MVDSAIGEGAGHLLVLIGSGETSPTMAGLHRRLRSLLPATPAAVILETPYRFEENADQVTAKAVRYLALHAGIAARAEAGLPRPPGATAEALNERALGHVLTADLVFAGPGSPSYALRQWRAAGLDGALRDRLLGPGVTVFASAAACTVGRVALPVYEIYKAGADPAWLEGLDLLGPTGLDLAVVPHFDNREGGTYDTSRCYVGERRLRALQAELPPTTQILGIDEHTAVILDLGAGAATVVGRGAMTLVRGPRERVVPAGTTIDLSVLRRGPAPVAGRTSGRGDAGTRTAADAGPRIEAMPPIDVTVERCRDTFLTSARRRDFPGMAEALLDLEGEIARWALTTLDPEEETEPARRTLRGLLTRGAEIAEAEVAAGGSRLERVLQEVLRLRTACRAEGDFAAADRLRAALVEAGVVVEDTAEGTAWRYQPGPPLRRDGVASPTSGEVPVPDRR